MEYSEGLDTPKTWSKNVLETLIPLSSKNHSIGCVLYRLMQPFSYDLLQLYMNCSELELESGQVHDSDYYDTTDII